MEGTADVLQGVIPAYRPSLLTLPKGQVEAEPVSTSAPPYQPVWDSSGPDKQPQGSYPADYWQSATSYMSVQEPAPSPYKSAASAVETRTPEAGVTYTERKQHVSVPSAVQYTSTSSS